MNPTEPIYQKCLENGLIKSLINRLKFIISNSFISPVFLHRPYNAKIPDWYKVTS